MKRLLAYLEALWYCVRPLDERHRSREAWIAWCKKNGKSPDGR